MEYRIIYKNELTGLNACEAETVRKYWQLEDLKFILTLQDIAKETGIKYANVGTLATKHAYCEIPFGSCEECRQELFEKARNREKFKYLLNDFENSRGCFDKTQLRNKLCSTCHKKLLKRQEEEEKKAREEKIRPHYDRMAEAISLGKEPWRDLSKAQFEVMKGIVRYQDITSIRKYVFKGDFDNSQILELLGALENANLIWVEWKNEKPEYFHFLSELKTSLPPYNYTAQPEKAQAIDPTFHHVTPGRRLYLKLTKNNQRDKERQPHYRNNHFILDKDVELRAGEPMIAGIWDNSDGSLTLLIQPLANINTATGKTIESKDPQPIQDVMQDLFRTLGEEKPPF